jgi:hypothetical protein
MIHLIGMVGAGVAYNVGRAVLKDLAKHRKSSKRRRHSECYEVEPLSRSYGLLRWYEEADRVEETLECAEKKMFQESMKILEDFLCNCTEEGSRNVGGMMTYLLAARNHVWGIGQEPFFTLLNSPWVGTTLIQWEEPLFEEIRRASKNEMQMDIALEAAKRFFRCLNVMPLQKAIKVS